MNIRRENSLFTLKVSVFWWFGYMEVMITSLLKIKVRKIGYQNMRDILKEWNLKRNTLTELH